jgi:hypothetical protein
LYISLLIDSTANVHNVLQNDQGYGGSPLAINGVTYATGIAMHVKLIWPLKSGSGVTLKVPSVLAVIVTFSP